MVAGARVVLAVVDSSTSISLVLPCITTDTTALPLSFLLFEKGFLCTLYCAIVVGFLHLPYGLS